MKIAGAKAAGGAWPPLLATRGAGGKSRAHAHHGMHVVIACEGVLRFRLVGAPWTSAAGVIVAPDVRHEIDAEGVEVLLVFVDPESRFGAMLEASLAGDVRAIDARERQRIGLTVSPTELMTTGGEAWLARLGRALGERAPARPRRAVHPRVRRALAILAAGASPGRERLDALAREVGLSPSRFMHAFTESVGIPLRPYVAWLRLQRATAAIARGEPLARAAAQAGYADAAHMTRSFTAMLGLPPSMLRPKGA